MKYGPVDPAVAAARFEKYANGVVYDTKTGLEWYAGPDKDMVWDQARIWLAGLKVAGGGWRMPTRKELGALYQKGVGTRNMTPLLKTTGWCVWAAKTTDSSSARHFNFSDGRGYWASRSNIYYDMRGFAVRSRR
jgi:hypothetical protein